MKATKILFANRWYPVIEEVLIGRLHAYKIEDEPGHYDFIHSPDDIKYD